MSTIDEDPEAVPAAAAASRRLLVTAEGTSSAAFSPLDWALVLSIATVWGGSFLLIAEALESMQPGVIALVRLAFGWLTLSAIPAARRTRIDRDDFGRVALLGLIWFAIPMTMFPIAEQWVSSSVAGMLNGAIPLCAAVVAAILLGRAPGRNQIAGLLVGLVGVIAISLPSLRGGSRTALGVGVVLIAIVAYGFAGNLVVPLQQKYGSIAVIWRAQLVAMVLTTPYALTGIADSSIELKPVLALLVLGSLGTGFAFVAAGTVFGRVGGTRGAIIAYLIPVVALVLGVLLRDEHVEAIAVAGLGLVLVGAWLTSRAGR